jgi:hypothetical protein
MLIGFNVRYAAACLAALLLSPPLTGYSVLTHEAIIDSAWDLNVKPLLLARFPQSTPAELKEAHSYIYAGCIIQDMGYYPFGSKFFTDLTHFVRSGDFVINLLRESQNLNEYAFALGALAHYAADNNGHPVAVNRSVPIEYPDLKRKYGDVVTYAENPSAHIRIEFGFDVLQIARGNYAPQSYHDFIGFNVSKPVLQRAFHDTYSIELQDIFSDLDLALSTYRYTVSTFIPTATRAAWNIRKKELQKITPGLTRRQFIYNLSRANYHKEWDRHYRRPGLGVRLVTFLLRILPKIGPLRALAFKAPTTQTELLFQTSFDRTLKMYRTFLDDQQNGQLKLENRDFDTGEMARPAEYPLADEAFAKLAVMLADRDPASIDPQIRTAILDFFQNPDLPFVTKKNPEEWTKTLAAVAKLRKSAPASP